MIIIVMIIIVNIIIIVSGIIIVIIIYHHHSIDSYIIKCFNICTVLQKSTYNIKVTLITFIHDDDSRIIL